MKRNSSYTYTIRKHLSSWLDSILSFFLRVTLFLRTGGQASDTVILAFFVAHLGDFVILLDSLKSYRSIYPNKKLILLCAQSNDMSILARHCGYIDDVMVIDDRWTKRIKTIFRLTRISCDTVVNVHISRTLQGDLYIMAVKANIRIAAKSDYTMMKARELKQSDRIYSRIISCDGIGTMELIRNAQYVRGQGALDFKADIPKILPFSVEMKKKEKYFVICPGSDGETKRWPVSAFQRTIDWVLENTDFTCKIIGILKEKELAERIRNGSKYPLRIENDVGKTSLQEYIEEIRNAKFLISSDTSAGHIAPAVRTYSVVIGSGWDKGRFFPYKTERESEFTHLPICPSPLLNCLGCGKKPIEKNSFCIVNGTLQCVSAVTPESVREAVKKILRNQINNS